jgi:hypothetical protein
MTCRECALLRVLPDADGKVRIRKDRSYLCTAKIEPLRLPKSVRNYEPPRPSHIEPHEGEGCSYFVPRDAVSTQPDGGAS